MSAPDPWRRRRRGGGSSSSGNHRRRGRGSEESFAQRLDRAAVAMNPVLALFAIGLVVLNIMFAFSLVLPLRAKFAVSSATCSSVSAPALAPPDDGPPRRELRGLP